MDAGSVTGVTDTRRQVQLTNRFQPLQKMLTMNGDCTHQSMLADQTKNNMRKIKVRLLEVDSKNTCNIPNAKKETY